MLNLNDFLKEAHQNAVDHGFWEGNPSDARMLALIHSEWSEALEEYRNGRPLHYKVCNSCGGFPCKEGACLDYVDNECSENEMNPKPEGIAVELIDGCIRILDFLGRKGTVITTHDTLEKLMGTIHEDRWNVDLPLLITRLHFFTAEAYDWEVFGFAEKLTYLQETRLLVCIGTACAWIREQGLDPEALLIEKHMYNKTRPYKHGGKVI